MTLGGPIEAESMFPGRWERLLASARVAVLPVRIRYRDPGLWVTDAAGTTWVRGLVEGRWAEMWWFMTEGRP